MNAAELPHDVLSDLPEWQGATSTELAGGLTNRTWRLEKNGRKAVLKIDRQPRQAPYNTRFFEATVQTMAAGGGLAGSVIFADDRIYLCEYVEGTVWNKDFFDKAGNIERIALVLRRLHSLPLTGKSLDATSAANGYLRAIDRDTEFDGVCLDIVAGTQEPKELRFCHNDVIAENIIEGPELKFLDWEYARDNDPLFDLATIIEYHQLSEQQASVLLDAYFDGAGERWRDRVAEQQRLYLALYWLWMAAIPDWPDEELRKLGDRLTTSYS